MNQLLEGKTGVYSILLIAFAVTLFPLFFIENEVLQYTNGVFSYPLDDSFIHLAIARNLAVYNTWGITPHVFSSASSSIIYPLLLAGIFKLVGIHTLVPFVVNVVAGFLFLIVVQQWLDKQGVRRISQLIILIVVIFAIPLAPLIMCGMEHTLHLLFFFLFLTGLGDVFDRNSQEDKLPWKVYLYACLITITRFESMFILFLACGLLLLLKRWKSVIGLGLVGMLPIVVFGIYSQSKGSDFFPNSVLVKYVGPVYSVSGLISFFLDEFPKRLFIAEGGYNEMAIQRLVLILPLTYLLFLKSIRQNPSYQYILILLTLMSVVHLCFMKYSTWPRYEAYLIGSAVIYCCVLYAKFGQSLLIQMKSLTSAIACVLAIIALGPIFMRSSQSFEKASTAAISIHDQQFEMGTFVHQYYDSGRIAFNDIGAISYLSHGKNLDLWGLGNVEVARSKRNHYDSPEFLDSLCKRDSVKIAILYEHAFRGLVGRWRKIATWDIPYNVIAYDDSVSFYAVDSSEAGPLAAHLKEYQPKLPRGVIVRYYW